MDNLMNIKKKTTEFVKKAKKLQIFKKLKSYNSGSTAVTNQKR